MPESWEVADEDEWREIQRGILRAFGTGTAFVQQAIGKILEVQPPPPYVPRETRVAEHVSMLEREKPPEKEPAMPEALFPTGAYGEYQPYQPTYAGELGERTGGGLPALMSEWVGKPFAPELPKPVRELPVIGPTAEFARSFTSPIGLASFAAWPAVTTRMLGYGTLGGIAGYGAEELGAPRGTGMAAETALGLGGPFIGPTAERLALRGVGALPGAVREAAPVVRRTVAEELGGPKVPKIPPAMAQQEAARIAERSKPLQEELARIDDELAKQARAQEVYGIPPNKLLQQHREIIERKLADIPRSERALTEKALRMEARTKRGGTPLGPKVPEEGIPRVQPEGAPPTKPPAPPPTGDSGMALNDYFAGAPASEKAEQTLMRRYEGEVGLERELVRQQVIQAQKAAKVAGIKAGPLETPQKAAIIEALDYQGPAEDAITRLGLTDQEATYVRALRGILDGETAKMYRQIPDFKGREWYYTHEFVDKATKPTVGRGMGRGRFGAKPGFMRQRKLEGTILDILEQRPDKDLFTWDALETVERRVYRGIIYRQQMVVLQNMKRVELALPASEVTEEGWRVPKIGPAFESRPVPGQPNIYTQPWAVPDDIAKALEDHFGTSAFSANVPLRVLREAIATAKFVKVFGGLFQNIDYSTRTIGYATKYRDISMLGEIPKSLVRAYVPGLDAKVRALELKDEIIQALYRHGLNREAGLGFVGTEYERIAGELKLFKIPIAGRAAKAFGSGAFRNAHNSFVTGIGRRIVKARMAGGMSLEEAAAQTALDINESFSSLPNWQSVFRNPTTRDFLRTFLFSMAEQESWIRMPFRQKALLASIVVDVTVAANILNYLWHGEFLPASAYKPFTNIPGVDYDPAKEGPKVLGYNTGFLRPELPYTGPLGRKEYLDLLGQADTPIRILADPYFAAITRAGQLPSAIMQMQAKKETFGEKKIEGVMGWAKFAAKQVAPIPATSVFEEISRIGTVGALLQAGGINVSAERLGPLFLRRYKELTGKTEKPDIGEIRAAVNQYPELLEIQVEREKAGVKLGGDIQAELLVQRDETEGNFLQMIQAGQATGVEFRKAYQDFQAKRRVLNEQREYKEREGVSPEEAIAFEYWDVELQTGADGLPDWDTYFADRDAILRANADKVSVEDMKAWLKKYEADFWRDPTVRAKVEEMLDAEAVADEFFSIPEKYGVTIETERQIKPYIAQAQDIGSLHNIPITAALKHTAIPPELMKQAIMWTRRPDNPKRKAFWVRNPDKKELYFQFYRDIPLGMGVEKLAGVAE